MYSSHSSIRPFDYFGFDEEGVPAVLIEHWFCEGRNLVQPDLDGAVVERNPDPVIVKADDVGPAITSQVSQEAGVLILAPAPGPGAIPEVLATSSLGGWKVPSPLLSATQTPSA
jgi:hypothetical protein